MARRQFDFAGLLVAGVVFGLAATGTAADKEQESKSPLKKGKSFVVNKQDKPADTYLLYIGTYTGTGSKGIYVCKFDTRTGKADTPILAAEATSPSFLAIHPSQKYLFAVAEGDEFEGKKTGAVSAFAIDAKSGKLTFLNRQASEGSSPCHLVVDHAGKNVLVANYGAGSVACLPIDEDGKLRKASSAIQHEGSSVNKDRQEGPHAHSINVDANNGYVFAADLGLDKVLVYKLDADKGALSPNDPPAASVAPGAGPRHFAFHPYGQHAYVINEMGNTITAFAYDASKGSLLPLQTISTLPDDYSEVSHTAEVVVHPSGKFLYGSNRGHDSIAVFRIDDSGRLTFVEAESTQGKTPRNFVVDPTGAFLLAENQDSDNIVILKIDQETGALSPTGESIAVPKPCCIRMLPIVESAKSKE